MKILVLGSSGFVGRRVRQVLSTEHDVYGASRGGDQSSRDYPVDLTKRETIASALRRLQPTVIINCAGVVDKGEKAMLNPIFTSNLLKEVVASGLKVDRIIISGSAAEYGEVDKRNIPVSEEAPLNAKSGYGLSKLKETALALDFRKKYNLPIVIARIFNPIGPGMNQELLMPKILEQIQEIQAGKKRSIEVSRLDAKRDYINIQDVALAIQTIVENKPKEAVYNIGSGKSTSNKELIELLLNSSKIIDRPMIIETSAEPEPLVAIQADITRIKRDLGWKPVSTIEETIKELVHVARQD